ncbi:MAG: peroxidase-related enzyme [Chloroflexota bacterium]
MSTYTQSNDRLSWFTIPNREDIPAGFQKLFAKAEEQLGFLPNVFIGYMLRPTHFGHWFNHFRELTMGESELTRAEREMIGVVVSSENGCLYCLASHGADLRMLLEDPILGERIMLDYRRAGLNSRTRAILDYAVKITNEPEACSPADIEQLKSHGFSEEAIFDIIEIASMYNFTNRLASATGMLPNPEYHGMGR